MILKYIIIRNRKKIELLDNIYEIIDDLNIDDFDKYDLSPFYLINYICGFYNNIEEIISRIIHDYENNIYKKLNNNDNNNNILKSDVDDNKKLQEEIIKLKKENEKLKITIKEIIKLTQNINLNDINK